MGASCMKGGSSKSTSSTTTTTSGGSVTTNNAISSFAVVPTGHQGEIKMLLLGAGESGKSTIWKQMKLIHLEGFTEEDLLLFKPGIIENVVQLLQGLTGCVQEKGDSFSESNQEFAAQLLQAEVIVYNDFEEKYENLYSLWEDPAIQAQANDPDVKLPLVLMDSAAYWYKNIQRVLTQDYQPSIKDIIKSRTKTTGIQEILFEIDGYKFKLTDVGGQRSERKKWITCFQNLTAILFVVALSEYDQTLNEDESTNRMLESLKLFRGVVGNDALFHVSIILFLNKEDLFSEKIKRSHLKNIFPDYDGPTSDKDAAFEYIKNQFVSLNANPNRTIYTQVTVATDIDNIRQAMDSIKDIVIRHAVSGGKPV